MSLKPIKYLHTNLFLQFTNLCDLTLEFTADFNFIDQDLFSGLTNLTVLSVSAEKPNVLTFGDNCFAKLTKKFISLKINAIRVYFSRD